MAVVDILDNVRKFPFNGDPSPSRSGWASAIFAGITVLLSLVAAIIISVETQATTRAELTDLTSIVANDHRETQQSITAFTAALSTLIGQTSALTAQMTSLSDRLSQERADRIESEHRLENRQR